MKERRTGFITDFTRDVPRGLESRFLKRQTVPQARWQSPELIFESEALDYDPGDPGRKILVGALGDKLIGIEDNRHILTVAGSRAGKSVTLVANLLFYRGSALVMDPKAELATLTAKRRAALGQNVVVLDPFGRAGGGAEAFRARYNPLARLAIDCPTIIEDAGLIADAIVVPAPGAKDPHWDESARNFIEGLILHVVTDPALAGRRTLVTVRALIREALKEAGDGDDYWFPLEEDMLANAQRLRRNSQHEAIADALEGAANEFYQKSKTEQAGVLSTVRRHTKFLDYAAMRDVLDGDDLDLADLKRTPAGMSVYLCLPANRMGLCRGWLRIFVNQLLDAMERESAAQAAPVLVCLDEFPVFGHMRQLEDAAGQIASFGVKLWVILQDWGQGRALYGERWESFAANSGILQFFGNNDLATTEYISKRLGRTRVDVIRTGEVALKQSEEGLRGLQEAGELHELLTSDEVSRYFSRDDRLKRQLVIWAGYNPMMLQRVEYFDQDSPHYALFRRALA